eukprot:3571049-Prymnesium_polylepis.1
MRQSWTASSFGLHSHSQTELLRTGLGSFELRQGLATASLRAGGMVVPLYPAGFSGLPYRVEKRRPTKAFLNRSSVTSLAQLPRLDDLTPARRGRPLSSEPRPPGSTGP